jgi:hypothetical protein
MHHTMMVCGRRTVLPAARDAARGSLCQRRGQLWCHSAIIQVFESLLDQML